MADKIEQLISVEGYLLPFGAKDITPENSDIPVYLVPLTSEELAERDQLTKDQAFQEKAEADKVSARESALAKLAKLGLTVDEINALIP